MKGKLFVIEGPDGCGKQTQTQLLYERLKSDGVNIIKAEFPNYESESSSLVKMYLRGDFGSNPQEISPYISSTFFAADRYATYKTQLETFLCEGGIVLADRYTTSNMVHQASKLHDERQREEFLSWLCSYEYGMYGIPIPERVFFLDIPYELSRELIKNRNNKFSHEAKKDIHESDSEYMRASYEAAKELSVKYGWESVDCCREGKLLDAESIHKIVYARILKYL